MGRALSLLPAVIASRRRSNPGDEAPRSDRYSSATPKLLRSARDDGDLPGRHRTSGFLLVETLATFTISAFVLLGLVSAASVLLRAVDGSVARVERIDDLGRAMEAIRRDVAGLSRARWNGAEPQAFVFRGGPNSLYFAQGTQAIALREIVVDGRPTLARGTARLGARAASFDDLAFGAQREIWTGAARLRFAYVPRRERGVEPPARPSWPVGLKLPAAILVEAVDRETHRVLVATRVSIEANADIGCLDGDDADPAAGAAGAVAQPDPATQGSGGVTFGALPAPEALPALNARPSAANAGSDPFCSRNDEPGDKGAAGSANGGGNQGANPAAVAAGSPP